MPGYFFAFFGAALLATPAVAAPFCGMKPAVLLRNFGNIAFGNEHRVTRDDRLAKWTSPIRYRIADEVGVEPQIRRDLKEHMALLRRISGHPIRAAKQAEPANFRIIFTRLANYRAHLGVSLSRPHPALVARLARSDCAGVFQRRRDTNAIVAAVAIIPVDHARERGILYHCIVEETTQLLGLPNDSDQADFSLFNDHSKRDNLHCQDRFYLRLLYRPEIVPGMTKPAALSVARKLIRRIKITP